MASNPLEIQLHELKDMIKQLKETIDLQTQMLSALQSSLDAANHLLSQKEETIAYLKKQLYGASSEKRKKPQETQADGQLTLFDMFAQIFDEAEYDHDPKVMEPEQVIAVKGHTRKAKKTGTRIKITQNKHDHLTF